MKKKFKRSTAVILAVLTMALSVIGAIAATVYIYDGFSYTMMSDNYISICGWDDRLDALTIPAQLDGSYIMEIADLGLRNDTYITSVDFASAYYLTRIGQLAFKGCTGIAGKVSIPNRITEVGDSAFQDCSSITSLEYYASSQNIPIQCFYNCSSLESVMITDGVSSIEKLAFANCIQLSYVRIPANVTYIAPSAFNGDDHLVIYCYTDSYAHQYAENKGITYVLLDAPEPTEPPTEPEPTEEPTEEPTDAPVSTEEPTQNETEIPTDIPTQPPTETRRYLLGDADNSGYIDIVDATFVQRYATGINIPDEFKDGFETRADVDSMSGVDSVDATFIMRFIVRIHTPHAIGEVFTA